MPRPPVLQDDVVDRDVALHEQVVDRSVELVGLTPRPTDSAPCGSKSTSSTLRPYSASAAPRLIVVVVLPTPPFWLASAMIRAGPCRSAAWARGSPAASAPAATSVSSLGVDRSGLGGRWAASSPCGLRSLAAIPAGINRSE